MFSRPAAPRAHRQPPGQLRLGRRGERPRLLVAHVDPLDSIRPPDGVHHRIQAVPDHAVDALHPGFQQDFQQLICERSATHLDLLDVITNVGHNLCPAGVSRHRPLRLIWRISADVAQAEGDR